MPATTPLASPPDCPPAVASAVASGDVEADRTPLHRSPVALRLGVVTGVLAGAFAVLRFVVRALDGALAIACAPLLLALTAVLCGANAGAVAFAVTREAGAALLDVVVLRFGASAVGVLFTAPLVVADAVAPDVEVLLVGAFVADGVGAAAGAVAVAGAGAAWTGGATTAAGCGAAVDAGGAAGVAGVPNPDGVQAQARPAPTTATPSSDKTAKLNILARCTPNLPVDWMTPSRCSVHRDVYSIGRPNATPRDPSFAAPSKARCVRQLAAPPASTLHACSTSARGATR